MTRRSVRVAAVASVSLPLVTACSYLNTRPGHPDSWKTTSYYDDSNRWPTAVSNSASTADRSPQPGSGTPSYQTAKTPVEIWQARGYAYNMHLRYEAAAFKAEDVQDVLAVPVFGLAIATVATGLAHASTVAVAATGLGGAAAGAGLSYLHPDKDAATDQTANSALLCVVDQSKILNDMSAIPLVLDRAALQDALSQFRKDAGPLLNGVVANQQAKSAVQATDSAAEAALQALDAAIAQYVALPSELFQSVDNIDQNAKTSGARTVDYASLLKSLQSAASNQTTTDQAKSQVQQATKAAASTSAPSVTAPKSAPPTNLLAISAEVAKATSDNPVPAATGPAAAVAGQPATGSSTKTASLTQILGNSTIGDMTRVNLLSKVALDDIPNPNFAAIASNIKACYLGK